MMVRAHDGDMFDDETDDGITIGNRTERACRKWALGLSFLEKVALAEMMGLELACCDWCGCFIGAPYCHPDSKASTDAYTDCECPEDHILGSPLT